MLVPQKSFVAGLIPNIAKSSPACDRGESFCNTNDFNAAKFRALLMVSFFPTLTK
jgi:hypothetical protein